MVSVSRILACFAAIEVLCACGTLEERYWQTGVRPEEWAEIRTAIRSITSSPVTFCSRSPHDPSVAVLVWTADNHLHIVDIQPNEVHLRLTRDGQVYTFRRVTLNSTSASNQSLEPTADRRVSLRILNSTVAFVAERALVSGGSAPSR